MARGIQLEDDGEAYNDGDQITIVNPTDWTAVLNPTYAKYKTGGETPSTIMLELDGVTPAASVQIKTTTVFLDGTHYHLSDGFFVDFDFYWDDVHAVSFQILLSGTIYVNGLTSTDNLSISGKTFADALLFLTTGTWHSGRFVVYTDHQEFWIDGTLIASNYTDNTGLISSQPRFDGFANDICKYDNIKIWSPFRIQYTTKEGVNPLAGVAIQMFDEGGEEFAVGDITEADGQVTDTYLLLSAVKTPADCVFYKSGYVLASETNITGDITTDKPLSQSSVPTISNIGFTPASPTLMDDITITCDFAAEPTYAFVEVGNSFEEMTITGTSGSVTIYGGFIGELTLEPIVIVAVVDGVSDIDNATTITVTWEGLYTYDPRQDIINTIGTLDAIGRYITVSGVKVYMWVDEDSVDVPMPMLAFSKVNTPEDMIDIGGDRYHYEAYIDVNLYVQRSSSTIGDAATFVKAACVEFEKQLKTYAKVIPNTIHARVQNIRDASVLETSEVKRYLIEVYCIGTYE